ncbi:MAG: hypothetical protein PSX80_11470 [bacterium]|nr:hypothetical protein [bacterium]
MLKWVTSLLLLFALTGQVWAGVCGCFEDHDDSHSCCKPDKSGKDSLAAPPCCSADCESIVSSQIPGKNTDRISQDSSSKEIAPAANSAFSPVLPLAVYSTVRPLKLLGHRLKLARPPDALYLRHHSFLI